MEAISEVTQKDIDTMTELLQEYTSVERSQLQKKFPNFSAYFLHKAPESARRFAEVEERERIEKEKRMKWEPTKKDLQAAIEAKGWPTFEQIRYDHIEDRSEREKLETAVSKVREFVEEVKGGAHGLSLIMVANQVDGDMDRTGYGCGKTTLAKAAYYSNSYYNYSQGHPESLRVHPVGKFYSAREIMAVFDGEAFDQRFVFQNMGKVIVIDDLGREGTLKWEKRDLDMQLQEKQDRYYSLINYCYDNDISLIITSNLTSREMATFLGGASWSRLLQMVPKKYRINMTGIRDMRPLLAEEDWF